MKIGELFVDLFIKTDNKNLKDFINDLGELRLSSVLNAVGLGGMYEGMRRVMEISDRTALAINNFTAQTGQSSQKLQQWSKFAEQFGIDAQVVSQSIETLQDNIMQMKMTGEGSNAWVMLGLDPRSFKDKFKLLDAMREKMKALPLESQRFLLGQLGMSKELVQLFNVADEEWKSIAKNMYVGERSLKVMRDYHRGLNELSGRWVVLLTDLGSQLAPVANLIFKILGETAMILDKFRHVIGPLMLAAGVALKNPALIGSGVALTAGDIMGNLSPTPAMSSVRNNKINFNITGSNAEDIARAVDKRIQEHLSDAEYQTPLSNN